MRKLLACAILATALPLAAAQAGCAQSDVYLFTRYTNTAGVTNPTDNSLIGNPSLHSGTVGCPRDESTPDGLPSTEYIYPGSNSFSARWVGEGAASTARVVLKDGGTTIKDVSVPLAGTTPTSTWQFYKADGSSDLSTDPDFTIEVTINGKKRTYRTVQSELP